MKMIDEIRRDNVAALAREYGGVKGLAEKLNRSDSQVSQWLNGSLHSETGKRRGMKADTARWIEKECKKTPGWLDQDHSDNGYEPETDHVTEFVDPLINEVISHMKKMSNPGKLRLVGMAVALAEQFPLLKQTPKSS